MDRPPSCTTLRTDGQTCRARALPGQPWCRWHDPSPEGRARHLAESRKGGTSKAYGELASVGALALDPTVAALDLSTAEGLRGLLAAALRALAHLPFDVRISTSIGQLATSQRGVLNDADFERRLAALESSQANT